MTIRDEVQEFDESLSETLLVPAGWDGAIFFRAAEKDGRIALDTALRIQGELDLSNIGHLSVAVFAEAREQFYSWVENALATLVAVGKAEDEAAAAIETAKDSSPLVVSSQSIVLPPSGNLQ